MTTTTLTNTQINYKPELPLTIENLVFVRRDGDKYYAKYEGMVEYQKTVALPVWSISKMAGKKNVSQNVKALDTHLAKERVEKEVEINQTECQNLVEAAKMMNMAFEPTNKVYGNDGKLVSWAIFFK